MDLARHRGLSSVAQSGRTAALAAAVVLVAVLIPEPLPRELVVLAAVAILVWYEWTAERRSGRSRHALDSLISMSKIGRAHV